MFWLTINVKKKNILNGMLSLNGLCFVHSILLAEHSKPDVTINNHYQKQRSSKF